MGGKVANGIRPVEAELTNGLIAKPQAANRAVSIFSFASLGVAE
jgi:hypothetical protein